MPDEVLRTVTSVNGNTIRITAKQWVHIIEAHDYMAGNLDTIVETLGAPSRVIEGQNGEALALLDYEHTNISRKTVVVVYREEPDGFVVTAFFTSKPEKIERRGAKLWPI